MSRHFAEWVLSEEPVIGTYGVVWFMRRSGQHIDPQWLAVKTLDPDRLTEQTTEADLEYLRREFRQWLELPSHYNVLTAGGFDLLDVHDDDRASVRLPVMKMMKMDGSLAEWVGNRSYNQAAKLIAAAQAFNGLCHRL